MCGLSERNALPEKEELIERLRAIASELGTTSVPFHEFRKRAKVSERKVVLLFGSYNDLVKAAGLAPRTFPSRDSPTYTDQQLLAEVVRVLRLPQAKPTRIFFEQNANVSSSVTERRFGGWLNTLRKASKLLDPARESALLATLQEYTEAPLVPQAPHPEGDAPISNEVEKAELAVEHPGHQFSRSSSPNVYGDFVNFRGLQHAPVNEQGVVFLFGMICRELGYVIEIVKPGFPDCEAKRRISGKPGKWQRVRIEFEFESRNFRAHGHDPDQCDLIVCWENNWPECPLEILELKKAIVGLPPSVLKG